MIALPTPHSSADDSAIEASEMSPIRCEGEFDAGTGSAHDGISP